MVDYDHTQQDRIAELERQLADARGARANADKGVSFQPTPEFDAAVNEPAPKQDFAATGTEQVGQTGYAPSAPTFAPEPSQPAQASESEQAAKNAEQAKAEAKKARTGQMVVYRLQTGKEHGVYRPAIVIAEGEAPVLAVLTNPFEDSLPFPHFVRDSTHGNADGQFDFPHNIGE